MPSQELQISRIQIYATYFTAVFETSQLRKADFILSSLLFL